MKITGAKQILNRWINNPNLPPLIMTGVAGIGKTQVVKDICKENGKNVEVIRIGSLDSPGDLLGLPEIKDGVTTFSKVEMFERLKPGDVLFLDEINRCKPVLLDSIMQILDQKKLANYDLSHCVIIGAMNPDTVDYNVADIDNAVIDRCLFISVHNTIEDVVSYFNERGVDSRVSELALLGEDKVALSAEFDLPQKSMTPRGLRQLNDIMPIVEDLNENDALELVKACVGGHGAAIWKNRDLLKSIPTAAAFFADTAAVDIENMDPLHRRVLLHRIEEHLKAGHKVKGAIISEQLNRLPNAVLGYVLRHLTKISNSMDMKHAELSKKAEEILKIVS